MPVSDRAGAAYHERLRVPLRWWAQGTMFVATIWLAVVVAVPGPTPWIVTGVALGLLAVGLFSYGDARVVVDRDSFRAGRARIDLRHVGAATALDAAETNRVAGRDADVRAFLLLRPYVKRSVRVEITDRADPAPYWLVSSRHPQALADALAAARDAQQ
ncbi:DUF3093 domain-containing protein [Nocardioides caeni]